jgi:hypothetical protein
MNIMDTTLKANNFIITLLFVLFFFISCSKDNDNEVPIVITAEITDIQQIFAYCGGTITSDAGSLVISRGVCWSTRQEPTIADDTTIDGNGAGSFTSRLSSLFPDSSYYVRAYATNSNGTGYGSTMSFTSQPYGDVSDIENNHYKTLVLGGQEWMAENLKVTRYSNNEIIPLIIDNTEWLNQIKGAYCNLNDDPTYGQIYGRIYNRLVTIDNQNVCPTGWHIPSSDEVLNLKSTVGVEIINEIGFFIKAGGRQPTTTGYFLNSAALWTSTEELDYSYIYGSSLNPESTGGNHHGFGIRCIKD